MILLIQVIDLAEFKISEENNSSYLYIHYENNKIIILVVAAVTYPYNICTGIFQFSID
jgi:hypothetical protein